MLLWDSCPPCPPFRQVATVTTLLFNRWDHGKSDVSILTLQEYHITVYRSHFKNYLKWLSYIVYENANGEEEWNNLIQSAELRWQFPNCFGAADRKHIGLFSWKRVDQNSISAKASIVFAFVDFNYWFLYAEVGMGMGGRLCEWRRCVSKHLIYHHCEGFP